MAWIESTDIPPKTEASVSLLTEGARRGAAAARDTAARATVTRDAVRAYLEGWASKESQNRFWRLYHQIQGLALCVSDVANTWKFSYELPDNSDVNFYTANFDEWTKDRLNFYHNILDKNCVDEDAQHQGFVVDGLQRFRAISLLDFSQEISAKCARRAVKAALSEIDNFSDEQNDHDLIALIRSKLSEKVSAALKLVVRSRAVLKRRPCDNDTRHRVLNFSIHTGNSPPPAMSGSRSAAGWALVNLITNARREDNATIQGQEVSRNLRNTIREKCARARFHHGTQNHADHGGSRKPTGYRHYRPRHSLARCA